MYKLNLLILILFFSSCSKIKERKKEITFIKVVKKSKFNDKKLKIQDYIIYHDLYSTEGTKKKILLFIDNNNLIGLKKILSKLHNINFTYKSKKLNTPLYFAIQSNNLQIVKLFYKNGANINYKNIDKITPLHYAVIHSSIDIVRFLVSKGSKINSQDKFGRTPLHYSSIENKSLIRRFLLSKSAENKNDIYNKTFLNY